MRFSLWTKFQFARDRLIERLFFNCLSLSLVITRICVNIRLLQQFLVVYIAACIDRTSPLRKLLEE